MSRNNAVKVAAAAAAVAGVILLSVCLALIFKPGPSADLPAKPVATEPVQEAEPTPRPLTLEAVREVAFADVPADAPWHDAVGYAAFEGLLGGTSQGVYSPELYVHRGCAATALMRLSGDEAPEYDGAFADISAADWYAPGAVWAVSKGYLTAQGGSFGPEEIMDRAALAGMLYRYAQDRGRKVADESQSIYDYWDGADVPEEDRAAMAWCLKTGLFAAFTDREAHPGYQVTRAQLAQVLVALRAGDEPVAKTIQAAQMAAHKSKSVAAHESLQAAIDDIAKSAGAVGVQVAVLEHGRVTDAFTYGRAEKGQIQVQDLRNGTVMVIDRGDMSLYHKLRVASISKVVVAMNAMALAEKGRFDLDGSIGQYWNCAAQNRAYPDVPVSARSILSHTSSIPMYGDDTSRRYDSVRGRLANRDFANLQPGNIGSWGYNNYAFGVLGMTLELAENRRYDDIADENFFLPLAIDAGVVPGELDHPEYIATLYRHSGEVGWSAASQRERKYTYAPGDYGNYFCGGLTASAVDIAKLYGVLAGDGSFEGQRLLRKASVEAMETPLGQPASQPFEQCYPLRRQMGIYGRDSLYYHTGSAYGVYNLASYDPATGDGVVVLTTGASAATDGHGIYAVCGKISQAVYAAIDDRPQVETPEGEPEKVEVPADGKTDVKDDVKADVKKD